MAKISPVEFFQQVRQETLKVTWPSRKETGVTTAMVFAMVLACALFFMAVDALLSIAVRTLIGFGG
jgi:preprotein translocase subunit SecE